MRRLNKEYRDVDSPTDILSWSYEQDQPETPSEHALWGELALCVDVSRRQSRDRGLDLETEILRLLVHGVAHLTGKDHEKSEEDERRMLQLEIELLSSLGVVGIY
jgi:probable rRNA maturation factor